MAKILCSRNRYLVPFMYSCVDGGGFDELVNHISNSQMWKLDNMKPGKIERDVYQVIFDSFVMEENQNNIGCSFSYVKEEKSPILKFRYTHVKSDFVVSIIDAGLFLFRTGAAFFWYEAELPQNADSEDVVLFQNEFKELTYERFVSLENRNKRYTFEEYNDPERGILMGHWIVSEILEKIPFHFSFFAERRDCLDKKKMLPDKAILFNYEVFEKEEHEKMLDTFYWLTNGYNSRYKRKQTFENELYEPFENAFCYAALGGCGYYAVPEADNTNFYVRTLSKKIMTDYFMLYVLVLYQAYTLLRFTKVMEQRLSAESRQYLVNSKETLDVIKELETEINVFLIKSIYGSVSHINHQNEFYEYLIGRMRVKENIDSLTVGLHSLQKLQTMREAERLAEIENSENQEREIADDRLSIGLGLISIFALVSAISDGYGAADVIVQLFGLSEQVKQIVGVLIVIVVGLIAVFAIGAITPAVRRLRKNKKAAKYVKEKSVKEEKECRM